MNKIKLKIIVSIVLSLGLTIAVSNSTGIRNFATKTINNTKAMLEQIKLATLPKRERTITEVSPTFTIPILRPSPIPKTNSEEIVIEVNDQDWTKTTMIIEDKETEVYLPNNIQPPTEAQMIQMQTEPIPLVILD